MKEVVTIIGLLLGSVSNATEWVVPSTGIVDYSGQAQTALPSFDVPNPSTVNNPLPDWSRNQITPTTDVLPLDGLTPCCGGY